MKVLIAGSGYNGWKTQVASDSGLVVDWERADDPQDRKGAVHHRRDKGKGPELMFAGPGAGTTKDRSWFGGASDIGSNSIDALVAQVPPAVEKAIQTSPNASTPIVILIKAHSRGAVAASRIAKILKQRHSNVRVELTQVDPVPGPGHEDQDIETDLGTHDDFAGLDETTVVYSVASGWGWGFTPQKVRGAKRIIVSRQNHSVGLQNGFIYEGELYKGSSLNSLPPGVYVDSEESGQNPAELRRMTNIAEAKHAIYDAWKNGESYMSDSKERMEIINAVVEELLRRSHPSSAARRYTWPEE